MWRGIRRFGAFWGVLVLLLMLEAEFWPHGWREWLLLLVAGPPMFVLLTLAGEAVFEIVFAAGERAGFGRLFRWLDDRTAGEKFSGARVLFAVGLVAMSAAAIWVVVSLASDLFARVG